MQPQSATLAKAITNSRSWLATLVEVVPRGATITDSALATLFVDGGAVDLDETRPVRRKVTGLHLLVDSKNANLIPKGVGDLLHPATGNELRIRAGRVTGQGTLLPNGQRAEMNWLGFFGLDRLPVIDTGAELGMTLAGLDRFNTLSRARWTDPFHVPTNTLIIDAMRRIIADRWGSAGKPLSFDASACADHPILEMTVPHSIFGADQTNADPTADLITLATAGGCEIFPDPTGPIILRPIVDPSTAVSVASYVEGENATIVPPLERDIDPTQTFSGVVVTGGSSTDPSCRAEVWSEPLVQMFGKVPAFYDSPLLRTDWQCQVVGQGVLHRLEASSETIHVTCKPNPGHEGSDPVTLGRERAGVGGLHLMSQFTHDLFQDMNFTSRSTNQLPNVPGAVLS